ncbi:transcription antitermination factor NusB [Pedobacter flavus]|uniref:Transcription antitermination factor NusB n=1 Tax=Pedobacter flavus TaxID=3113906 RepID=A0ABU7H1Y8_9SPHI|nr:transcription antitermination factor NusB [Pedobacter sp. VNH31]MEE1885228.1 transcription antitermination factor NusB [Pedobacter sp. VNH31]
MLNRRHLRIKALQNIFAWQMTDKKDTQNRVKALMQSIDQVNEMYVRMLALIVEITQYTAIDAAERANLNLPSEEDLNVSQKLFTNKFISVLKEVPEYVASINKYKINWNNDPSLIKGVFIKLKNSKEYAAYINDTEEETLENSKEIIKYIFRKIILKDVNVIQAFEDKFINWSVDREVMQGMVAKTIKNMVDPDPFSNYLVDISADWNEDSKFVEDLFLFTIKNDKQYQSIISERTKNWEADRIAIMDTILMKMAICEMMNFPTIPVKVTINEYLEISKNYSTPKSNTFINGILDKILNDLQRNNSIVKTGRGLMEG